MADERFDKGLQIRREVLGPEHVDRQFEAARKDPFMWPAQQLVTENAWGSVWARPELARRDRSLVTLAMLAVLNRPHELRVHLRGAVRNGLKAEEIREVFLHGSVYAGFPAALDGLRVVAEVLREMGLIGEEQGGRDESTGHDETSPRT